jgi:hypothetical protein
MTPFETYCTYLGMKRHFTTKSYDYIKYNGKVSANKETFNKRKDKFFFEKLAKHDDPKSFLLANFVTDSSQWIRNLVVSDTSREIYTSWLKKIQSLTYTIKNDIEKFDDNFDDNFKVKIGEHPTILRLFLSGEIQLETLVVITAMVGCIPYWNKVLKDDFIWQEISLKIEKYKPFLHYDTEKIRKICVDKFSI